MEQQQLSPGQKKIEQLRFGGFNDDEIKQWQSETSSTLSGGGFTPQEIKDYWGDKEPDTSAMKGYVKDNFAKEAVAGETGKPKEANSFFDALQAGWGMSVSGLIGQGGMPDMVLPEHSNRAMTIASQIATMAGDLPAMAAGGFFGGIVGAPVGGVIGSVVPVVGTLGGIAAGVTAGTGAGAFAAPAAIRKMLIDHYQRGDIKSAGEFMDRLASTTWEAAKQGTVGALTFGAGKAASVAAESLGAGAKIASYSTHSAELATMTAASAAVEGHLPQPEDFITNGLMIASVHGIIHGATKLGNIYAETGIKPDEVLEKSKVDPILKQEITSNIRPEPTVNQELIKVDHTDFNGEKVSDTITAPKEQIQLEKPVDGKVKLFNEKIPRSDAEMQVLSRVGEQIVPKDELSMSKFKTSMLDDLNPINDVVKALTGKEKIRPEENPYILARLTKGWHGMLERVTKFGTVDFETKSKVTGEGLADILKDIPNQDKDGFTAYGISRRAIEKSAQGIETGVPLDAAKQVVEEGKHFEDSFNRLVKFQDRMVDYAVEAGILNKNSSLAFKKLNQSYFPFHRIMEEDPLTGKTAKGSLFKQMKGSERELVDPLTTVYKNTAAIIRAAERNRVYNSLVDLTNKSSDGENFIQKSKKSIKPIEISEKEVAQILDAHGVDESVPAESFTVFRPRDQLIRDNEFMVYRDGKAEVYKTTPEISEALNALDSHAGLSKSLFMMIAKPFAQALRFGVTATPDFVLRNMFRDQIDAGIQSKFGQLPVVDILKSVGSMWKNDKVWQDFLSSGGASGGFGEVSKYIETNVWDLNKKTGFMNTVWNNISSPIQTLSAISEAVEQIPRLTEFRKAGGGTTGAFAARDVTVDFARIGARVKAANAIVPFLNAGLQGMDKMAQSFREAPAKTIANATAMITLPTMMLWWANRDDSRYQDAPAWQKDLYWLIPTDKWEKAYNAQDALNRPEDLRRQGKDGVWEVNNGTVFRLPKPFMYGTLFGSFTERALDSMYKKNGKSAFHDFDETIMNGLLPNIVPTIALPYAEQMMNRTFFTQKPIVPNHLEEVSPEYQYTEYTSETAKQLGKLIGYVPYIRDIGQKETKLQSPMVVDNYIKSWGGTLGQYAIDIADKALTMAQIAETKAPKPANTLADIPFIKAFIVRHPSMQAAPIQEFFNNYDDSKKIRGSVKKLIADGDIDGAVKLTNNNLDAMMNLDGIQKSLYNQNSLIHKINMNKSYSREDKRQLIDGLYYRMSELAKAGNKTIQQLKEKK